MQRLAVNQAKAKVPNMAGNTAFDQLQQTPGNAVSIVGKYLNVTASEPKIDYYPNEMLRGLLSRAHV